MSFAVLCPGQGAQHADLFDLLPDALRVPFDADRLYDNAVAQPTICALQLRTWALLGPQLAALGIEPALFAGYSVGELAAHGCAGALSFDATVALARERAAAMDTAGTPGDGLIALRGLALAKVVALCTAEGGHLAIVNGDDHALVGGDVASLAAIEHAAVALGATVQRLPVAIAAHTPLLAAAVGPFRACLEAVAWSTPVAPVLAGIDAAAVSDRVLAVDRLARQVATTIRWVDCMDGIVERGVAVCLELGPGAALARMLHERHPHVAVRSVADFRSLAAARDWVVRASG